MLVQVQYGSLPLVWCMTVLAAIPRRKRASYSLVAEWVSESWNEVPEDTISRSFLKCGLFPLRGHGLEELHSKLRSVLEEKVNAEEEDSHTGITDEEDGSEGERSDEDKDEN